MKLCHVMCRKAYLYACICLIAELNTLQECLQYKLYNLKKTIVYK